MIDGVMSIRKESNVCTHMYTKYFELLDVNEGSPSDLENFIEYRSKPASGKCSEPFSGMVPLMTLWVTMCQYTISIQPYAKFASHP
jgi:hypothetical protein